MLTEQRLWTSGDGWSVSPGALREKAQLVLAFGPPEALDDPALLADVAAFYPGALLAGCSTAGEVHGERVHDGTLSLTAVSFQHTAVRSAWVDIPGPDGSREAGARLAAMLPARGLRHVLVLSDGLAVNGSELSRGLVGNLPSGVGVSGGLAGDATRFGRTVVLCDGRAAEGAVSALGLYSDRLRVGLGSMGGWDPFGPDRLVTKSQGNVLYELDGRNALDLYQTYLGKHAGGLPATGLFYPLCLCEPGRPGGLVRTILGVDGGQKAMIFAGDIPEGAYARFMKANLDRLVEGSRGAAARCRENGPPRPRLAVLISCIGRKLVLGQRVEEEVEAVREELGPEATLTGFYSYGEIAPAEPDGASELHNQTMTVTTFAED